MEKEINIPLEDMISENTKGEDGDDLMQVSLFGESPINSVDDAATKAKVFLMPLSFHWNPKEAGWHLLRRSLRCGNEVAVPILKNIYIYPAATGGASYSIASFCE